MEAPVAKQIPFEWSRPTGPASDPWAWLRDRDDPDTVAYLEAENAYADAWFAPRWYTARTEEGLSYAIHCRGASRETATEHVLLDENVEAAGTEYFSLGLFEVTPDHALAAWSCDVDGSELYTLRIRDLATGNDLADVLTGTSAWGGAAWSADGAHLFYMMPDEQMRPFQVWRHAVGTAQADDVCICEETDERFYLGVELTRSTEWIVLESSSKQTSQVWLVPAADPHATPISVRDRVDGLEYSVDHWGAEFVVLTNLDAEDFRVMRAPLDRPADWDELVPHVPGQRITACEPFADHLVIHEWANAQQRVRIVRRDGYEASREWATAGDGTLVPVDIVRLRGSQPAGDAPCLVFGYGSYEASMPPWFSVGRISLLDRGWTWALVHPRGGGELGRRWYTEGKLLNKRNTFTDTISSVEHLISSGWAHPDRVVIRGGSAGGLLVGACMTMRPDLFAAVVAEVPFVDAVTTMSDPTLPLTITEWEEWGDPRDEPAASYMLSYSPYDNTIARDYPALYITAGLNDPRVSYHEPAKWCAKLRALRTNDAPLIMKTEMGAGHGGPSGRYDRWRDEALVSTFTLVVNS
ncbi:MAG: S9 family peptidase [Actinobacteria bacterium]|nr:S9 family peptidase [Actinomycetota bacterium]